eukprot:6090252-Prymnesium_polylepis.1
MTRPSLRDKPPNLKRRVRCAPRHLESENVRQLRSGAIRNELAEPREAALERGVAVGLAEVHPHAQHERRRAGADEARVMLRRWRGEAIRPRSARRGSRHARDAVAAGDKDRGRAITHKPHGATSACGAPATHTWAARAPR